VTQPVQQTFAFEDVHFEFDRSSLRPDALRVLDEAVAAMQANSTLRLTIEGHTCNIGTAEYNLALGERRAVSVRDYLTRRGPMSVRRGATYTRPGAMYAGRAPTLVRPGRRLRADCYRFQKFVRDVSQGEALPGSGPVATRPEDTAGASR
jgi:hypothetical protein